MDQDFRTLAVFAVSGAVIGVGQLLNSTERITVRTALGRAVVCGGLALASSTALVFFPAMPFVAQVGVACMTASLGTSFLERMAQKYLGK